MSIGILVILTFGIIVWVTRQSSQSKNSRTDRLLTEEGEFRRTFINLVALEFKKYVLDGNPIDDLIKSCAPLQAKFTPWYQGDYQGVHYAVSACDNHDSNADYTLDADETLWFKIDANYPGGREKTYFALLTPNLSPSSPTPSPGITPTPTATPDLICYSDTAVVSCPSPTPCTDGKGDIIACPSPTPCQAQDTAGLWGVVNAWIAVPCTSCTDKFGTPSSCPSPTIPPPPPSPTPTPTPTPPPSPTAPPSPTPPPCNHNPSKYASGGLLNSGGLESVTANACGISLQVTMRKEGSVVRYRCYRSGAEVGTQTKPFDTNSTYWINAHISFHQTNDNPGTVFCWGEKTPWCTNNCGHMYDGTVY